MRVDCGLQHLCMVVYMHHHSTNQKIRTSPFACGFMFVYIVRSWLWLLVPRLWLRIMSLMFDYEALFARHVRGLRGSGYNVRNGQGR